MNERRRFLRTMRYEEVDRPPIMPAGPWVDTLTRWHSEGFPENTTVLDYFDLPRFKILYPGPETGVFPRFEERVLKQEGDFVYSIDHNGITNRRYCNSSAMPEYVDYPIKTPEDLERFTEKRFSLDNLDRRFPDNWEEIIASADDDDRDAVTYVDGGCLYGHLRRLAGVATCSLLFYDAPEAVDNFIEHVHQIAMYGMRKVFARTSVDYLGFGEDIAYKTSTLISPDMFRALLLPRYKAACDLAAQHGVDIVWYDSDGNLEPFMDMYLEIGINGLAPCEAAAGMDPVRLRKKYGRQLRMIGGIDKREIAKGEKEIKAELDSKRDLIAQGGYIPKIDHSVASDISFENYSYYINTFKKMLCLT